MKRIYNKSGIFFHEQFQANNLISGPSDYKKNIRIIIDTNSNVSNYSQKKLSEIQKDDKFAILTLNAVAFMPDNILDFSQVFCPHCKER